FCAPAQYSSSAVVFWGSSLCFLGFLLAGPGPASSTLFPYTTLFRSGGIAGLWGGAAGGEVREPRPDFEAAAVRPRPGGEVPAQQDRKSTRLNSSHVKISYAVFCLTEKNYLAVLATAAADTPTLSAVS